MRRFIFFVALFSAQLLYSQVGEIYYVPGSILNLRSGPSTNSEILEKLKAYDNVEVLQVEGKWMQVVKGDLVGYVHSDYIKKGKAVVSTYSARTGAKCRDGTSSYATGRGACSHHGGVAYWKTAERQTVRIE